MGTKSNTYTKSELRGYLVGMFGQNVLYNIVSTGLYFYYQNVICLPAMAIGWIFTLARVWDAINDPMMGSIVDKTRSKRGKCRPYLIVVPGIIGVVTILTFLNGNYVDAATQTQRHLIIAWAAVSYVLWGMSYTVGDIPLWGITSLMTEDESDRGKILGLARIVAGVGGLGVLIVQIAQAVGNSIENTGVPHAAAQQKGFILTAIVMTVISSILFEFAGLKTRERVHQSKEHYTLGKNFKTMVTNKPFRQILISGILRSPIQLLMIVAMPLLTYYYANGNIGNVVGSNGVNWTILINVAILAVGVLAGQFVAMAITPGLIKKVEKKVLYNFYSLVGAVPFVLIFVFYKVSGGNLMTIGWSVVSGLCFFLAGGAMGGINVLQSVMIADCIDYEEYTNGVRTDGVFFAGQSFITKLSAGIATIFSSVIYNYVGYSAKNVDVLNTALKNGANFMTYNGGSGAGKYAATMFFLVSIPPAIGMVLSALPTLKYALTDKEHAHILDSLVAKRAERNAQETTGDQGAE